ncbi:cysteine--tRNA ligase [Candidatus Pacearchaeota archaeon]|nr:cysteine--tRNA ligase [Candidatus Pacearchaeota archaeon]
MEKIKLYNTLTKKKEKFKPLKKGNVSIYSCGPTVYWFQHIGNLRTYIFTDILRKTFEFNNYKVKHVINVTDVGHLVSDSDTGEDKMERAAKKEKKSAKQIADFYFSSFLEDLKKLNISMPSKWPKATEHIKEQIDMIQTLEKKGYTYKTSDGIYFNTKKFKSYGKLSNLNISKIKAGSRVSLREKKNTTDFALWKFSSPEEKRQQEWPSPWGVGFPGWHIECSAMSTKYLGKTFDIHTGGQEHIQVHHTNEIAQSECCYGKRFVNYWMHTAWLLSPSGQKVSKSKGGLYTLSELESLGYKAEHFRYLALQTHYKKPLKFSLENLDAAKTAFERLKSKIITLKDQKHKGKDNSKPFLSAFTSAINEDLNIPKALSIFLQALDDFSFNPKDKLKLLKKFDFVLSLGIEDMKESSISLSKKVKSLVSDREALRKAKKYAEADIIRQRILEQGYEIEDSSEGTKLSKV